MITPPHHIRSLKAVEPAEAAGADQKV